MSKIFSDIEEDWHTRWMAPCPCKIDLYECCICMYSSYADFIKSGVITCAKLVILQRVITFIFPPAHAQNIFRFSERLECHDSPKSLSKCRIVQIISNNCATSTACHWQLLQTHRQAILSVSLISSELSLQKCKANSRMALLPVVHWAFEGNIAAEYCHLVTNSTSGEECQNTNVWRN